jgi:hypothetical protein
MTDTRSQLQAIVGRSTGHPVAMVPVQLLAEHLGSLDTSGEPITPAEPGAPVRHHHLKTRQPFYDRVADGTKPFEYRLNDRAFQPGDIVHLWEYLPEYHPHARCYPETNSCGAYRRQLIRRIGFLLAAGPRIPLDVHVVFSLLPMAGAS